MNGHETHCGNLNRRISNGLDVRVEGKNIFKILTTKRSRVDCFALSQAGECPPGTDFSSIIF